MPNEPPQTVGDLCRTKIIAGSEIEAAVDAYHGNLKVKAFQFASGYVLDVAETFNGHRPAKAALGEKGVTEAYRRTMVRTVVILAVPVIE